MQNSVRASAKTSLGSDPTVYPVEEKMGEDMLQRWIAELLRPLLLRWLVHRGKPAFVGADQFIYYQPHTPTLRVSPDIYVLPGVPPETRVTSWKTWEKGIVPSFALEIVSTDWEKDYIEGPARYREMGIAELIVFDPASSRHADGVRWQVFRRVAGRRWARVEASDGDRVWSKALGCFLRAVGSGDGLRVRVGTGPGGEELFSTGEEAERTAKEAERTAKEAALERVLELERQLRKLQSEGRRKPRKSRRQ
ncbi:MAG TPA: Uma2 family endonuclease [Polyangia bacterium]|jgi:Uma2 family endonuclease|nr:Uma2 family endonuclease [Polyangia bacterium]